MRSHLQIYALALILLFGVTSTAYAVAPAPGAIEKFKEEGRWDEIVAQIKAFREAGGCQPVPNTIFTSGRFAQKIAASPAAVETLYVPVILVDFPDFKYNQLNYPKPGGGIQSSPAVGTQAMFDSILFSMKGQPGANPTGSMTDYFTESSYGKVYLTGDVYGWFTVESNYSFYVAGDNGMSLGPTLAHDAVVKASSTGVDFTKYDNDGDGEIDGVVVVHAGPGAETGAYGVWSHRWNMPIVHLPNNKYALAYTINPEEFFSAVSPIGVFCHEYGHVLGLPDLYDTDGSHTQSEGLGAWSLMASGNYNGNSRTPAHFDPWCKHKLGYIDIYAHQLLPTSTNLHQAAIPQAETEPFVYYMATVSGGALEYFLIENRQHTGFDVGLPGEGLCIYHIDELTPNNNNPSHYKVALLQADGFNQLAFSGSRGDNADPFPGATNKRNWHDRTEPNSRHYDGSQTQFAAWNISNSDSVMYADLDCRWSRPWVQLYGSDSISFADPGPGGNGNGIPEAGETISFTFGVRNFMRGAFTTTATLTSTDPSLVIQNPSVLLNGFLSPSNPNPTGPQSPIMIEIPTDWETKNVSFTLKLDMDSTLAGGDTTWHASFSFKKALGRVQVLLVDDDNGKSWESQYKRALDSLGLPYSIWAKKTQSNPLSGDLAPYKNVIWFVGNEVGGGVIDDIDVASMKAHMNAGKNVCVAGVLAPQQIWSTDSTFMKDYFHSRIAGSTPEDAVVSVYDGVAGNGVSNQLTVGISSAPVSYVNTILTPLSGGVPTFTFKDEFGSGNYGNGGVIYSGTHRSIMMSFAPEFLVEATIPVTLQPLDTLLTRILNFFATGVAAGVDDDNPNSLPEQFVLSQNYPNPFNPTTTIAYTIPYASPTRPTHTTLKIYNVMGQEVATVVDRVEGPGSFTATWDGKTTQGGRATSGVYFYRLTHGDLTTTKKMVLLK